MTRKTYCGNLLWQSSLTLFDAGTDVTYEPHKGRPGGIISENVREAVEAHEEGHANYVIDVICPILRTTMSMLESKWLVLGWTEAKVRDEIRLATDQLKVNVYRKFHEAANAPTIDWFNSSPEWKLVHDAQIDGKWKWVKE